VRKGGVNIPKLITSNRGENSTHLRSKGGKSYSNEKVIKIEKE
jgi:hypothetical protein